MYQALEQRVRRCIASKHEEESWDFKKSWHTKKCDLLHDIICMSNLLVDEDGLIIIGCDEDNDYQLCDVSENPERKNTAQLVVFLRDKKFAAGVRPVAWVHTMVLRGVTLDVIVVKNTRNTPYYLSEQFEGVRAHHIYTRVMDTNTPIDKSADPDRIEKLWRKHFALDCTALDRVKVYLSHPEDWESTDGEESFFYKYAPEFTIVSRRDETRTGHEYYMFGQIDITPYWYDIDIKCHQTVLYATSGLALDGGRLFTSCPNREVLHTSPHQSVLFSAYTEETIQYSLHSFYFYHEHSGEGSHVRDTLLECVPLFRSDEEKAEFLEYARQRYASIEIPADDYRYRLPARLEGKSEYSAYADDYRVAMRTQYLLEQFRTRG